MRSARSRRVLAVSSLGLAAVLAAAGVALAAATAPPATVPFGKYTGSAVSSGGGDAIAITVYITGGMDGDVEVTGVTSKLPVPVTVRGTPAAAGNGYDIPISVDMETIGLSGTGVVHLRPGEGDWVLYGSGDGTFRSSSGSGRGYAKRVSADAGTFAQVSDALAGFFAFGPAEEAAVTVPPEFSEAANPEPAPAGNATAGDSVAEPFSILEVAGSLGFWLLLLLIGLI